MRIRLVSLIALSCLGATSRAEEPKMPDAEIRFATRLFGEVGKTPGNLFLSPTSIRFALGMAYAGARGETAAQMQKALGLPPGKAGLDVFAELLKRWDTLANPPAPAHNATSPEMQKYQEEEWQRRVTTLNVVDRLYAQKGTKFLPDWLAVIKDKFRASAVSVDFAGAADASRKAINKWVSDETRKKIPELIPAGTITPETKSVLVNAIYFKASWENTFDEQRTKEGPFFTSATAQVKARLMQTTEHFMLGHAEGAELCELPYGDGKLSMVVVLPTKKDGLAAVEKKIAQGALPGWLKGLTGQRVQVTLPRFKMGASFELAGVLKKLDMPLPFTFPGADFSGMDGTKLLYIGVVIHQAVVAVDEKGTEAAAATAVLMKAGGMPSEPAVFRADHPFVFLIRDRETNSILFMGRLADPTK
jgi:serpin B